MCSQADDPSQHVSDDTLRAALDDATQINHRAHIPEGWADTEFCAGCDQVWPCDTERVIRAALAVSATDEGPRDDAWLRATVAEALFEARIGIPQDTPTLADALIPPMQRLGLLKEPTE